MYNIYRARSVMTIFSVTGIIAEITVTQNCFGFANLSCEIAKYKSDNKSNHIQKLHNDTGIF